MKTSSAYIYTVLESECPHCGATVKEQGGNVQDLTGYDFEEETELECDKCGKEFIAVVEV